MNKHGYSKAYQPPPFPIVAAAVAGDIEAIGEILAHYEKYISTLSTAPCHNAQGSVFSRIDETLRSRLESKLVAKILTFRMT